jgi:3',5'-cyclic AMP phosphodiesterase CpdA
VDKKPAISRRDFLFGLTALSILPFSQEARAAAEFEPFQFGYLTGSYLATKMPDSYKLLQESQLFLQDAIKGLNRDKLDFVLFGGDNVEIPGKDEENWQLFIDIAQSLNCPWNFVIGEQDVSGPAAINKMDLYGRDWKGKGLTSGHPYWSYDPANNVHVVGLDTTQSNSSIGNISESQLSWFKQDLGENRNKFTIVLSHHPLLPPNPFDSGGVWDDYICPQGPSAREIIGSHSNVRLAISGHVHVNQIQQEKDVWYVSSPSLAVYPCAYRIFRVSPQSVTVETYQISFPALLKKARKQVETWSLPYKYSPKVQAFCELLEGSKEDQNVRLSLKVAGKKTEVNQPKMKKGKDNEEPKDKDKDKGKGKDKEKEKDKDKSKSKDHDKNKDQDKNSDKSKDKGRDEDKKSQDKKDEKDQYDDVSLTKNKVQDEKQMNDVKEQNSEPSVTSPTPVSTPAPTPSTAPTPTSPPAPSKSPRPTPTPMPRPSAKPSASPAPSPILPTGPQSSAPADSTSPTAPTVPPVAR